MDFSARFFSPTDIALAICGSTDLAVQKKLRDSVAEASGLRRERLCVAAGGKDEDVDGLIARAGELNHERVVLVAPGGVDSEGTALSGLTLAAAVAGAIAGMIKDGSTVEIQAVGAGAVNQAVKAVAISRGFLSPVGIEICCIPSFADIVIDGEYRTAIRFSVEPRAGFAVIAAADAAAL